MEKETEKILCLSWAFGRTCIRQILVCSHRHRLLFTPPTPYPSSPHLDNSPCLQFFLVAQSLRNVEEYLSSMAEPSLANRNFRKIPDSAKKYDSRAGSVTQPVARHTSSWYRIHGFRTVKIQQRSLHLSSLGRQISTPLYSRHQRFRFTILYYHINTQSGHFTFRFLGCLLRLRSWWSEINLRLRILPSQRAYLLVRS